MSFCAVPASEGIEHVMKVKLNWIFHCWNVKDVETVESFMVV